MKYLKAQLDTNDLYIYIYTCMAIFFASTRDTGNLTSILQRGHFEEKLIEMTKKHSNKRGDTLRGKEKLFFTYTYL